jgi:hypothetical protein
MSAKDAATTGKKCTGAIFIADPVADAIRAADEPVEMDVLLREHLSLSA